MRFFWNQILKFTVYNDPGRFIQDLEDGNERAIVFLFGKIIRPVEKMVRNAGLDASVSKEILDDTAIVFIRKIREKSFTLTNAPPHTFALQIARWLIQNYKSREQSRHLAPVNPELLEYYLTDHSTEREIKQWEDAQFLNLALNQLPETCRLLITLRYFKGYSDEDVIAMGVTPFTTINSLKNRRKECLHKLRGLVLKTTNY